MQFIVQFIVSIIIIYIAFMAIREIDFAKRYNISLNSGRILQIMLSIALGYLVSGFIFSIIQLITSIRSSFS